LLRKLRMISSNLVTAKLVTVIRMAFSYEGIMDAENTVIVYNNPIDMQCCDVVISFGMHVM